MQRKLIHDLCRWKANSSRKPLVLEGARQVGKTYLLQQFDRLDPDIAELFAGAIHPARIIDFLAVKYSTAIVPGETLIIFDEVQELPRALASLKYFAEDAPEYHIVAAGSLLGVTLSGACRVRLLNGSIVKIWRRLMKF
jgi:predicted AAA+ superfamily ATPase